MEPSNNIEISNKQRLEKLLKEWKGFASLGWPISVQTAVRTGMRTTDLLVVALFSSSAIAAVGLANLYTQIDSTIYWYWARHRRTCTGKSRYGE